MMFIGTDVIVFKYPEDPSRNFIKRVIALGNETIEIQDKQVYIDGKPIEEPYKVHKEEFFGLDCRKFWTGESSARLIILRWVTTGITAKIAAHGDLFRRTTSKVEPSLFTGLLMVRKILAPTAWVKKSGTLQTLLSTLFQTPAGIDFLRSSVSIPICI